MRDAPLISYESICFGLTLPVFLFFLRKLGAARILFQEGAALASAITFDFFRMYEYADNLCYNINKNRSNDNSRNDCLPHDNLLLINDASYLINNERHQPGDDAGV